LGNDQRNQLRVAGVLQVDHARSILRPLIPEQIPFLNREGAKDAKERGE